MRHAPRFVSSPILRPRRGSIYILVLVTSMLVAAIGISAIAIARINTRRTSDSICQQEARSLAVSGVELAVALINHQPNGWWRGAFIQNVETTPLPYWNGTISWKFVDEDGDLADDPADPVRVHGIGRVGQAVWAYSVLLAGTDPLDVLNTCIHSAGELDIKSGRSLTATGAPASTNANFNNDGDLFGSIDAVAQSGGGNVSGAVNIPATPKQMPTPDIYLYYASKATPLPFSGDLDSIVLAPGVNEYGGGLNPEGIYLIQTGGSNLTIKDSRIHGTLIVAAGGKKVVVDNSVFMHNYRADNPVLIVDGDLELRFVSGVPLSEGANGHNFNPPGAHYQGQDNTDQLDTYPSEIRGLVYCSGDLSVQRTAQVRGVVIAAGTAIIEGTPTIIHDSNIPANPPVGCADATGQLSVEAGSWQRESVP